jgi:hypothetical protein
VEKLILSEASQAISSATSSGRPTRLIGRAMTAALDAE